MQFCASALWGARVLAGVGAIVPRRDEVDSRIIGEVEAETGMWPDTEEDVGGYPSYDEGTSWPDGDGDGIDDDWERSNGLDPSDSSDSARLADSGYMWVEIWANSLF